MPKTIKVKYMRDTDNGVRFRYMKQMLWFPKSVLVDWDDSEFHYYNEELEVKVKDWFIKKLREGINK